MFCAAVRVLHAVKVLIYRGQHWLSTCSCMCTHITVCAQHTVSTPACMPHAQGALANFKYTSRRYVCTCRDAWPTSRKRLNMYTSVHTTQHCTTQHWPACLHIQHPTSSTEISNDHLWPAAVTTKNTVLSIHIKIKLFRTTRHPPTSHTLPQSRSFTFCAEIERV